MVIERYHPLFAADLADACSHFDSIASTLGNRFRTDVRIDKIPSDTQMRDILDPVEVDQLNECFADLFHELQRGGVLKKFFFLDGHYLLAIDGTGYFSSSNIDCPSCLEKIDKAGNTKYAHQMVAAVLVHPDQKEVIPLAIEPIVKQDGETKNDCERNATKRLLARIKQQHPKLKLIVTEDGLSSNAPHINDLRSYGYHYILGAKPGDHLHLFKAVIDAGDQGQLHSLTTAHLNAKGLTSETQWVEQMPLNASHADLSPVVSNGAGKGGPSPQSVGTDAQRGLIICVQELSRTLRIDSDGPLFPPDAACAFSPDGPGTERQGEHRYERLQSADL